MDIFVYLFLGNMPTIIFNICLGVTFLSCRLAYIQFYQMMLKNLYIYIYIIYDLTLIDVNVFYILANTQCYPLFQSKHLWVEGRRLSFGWPFVKVGHWTLSLCLPSQENVGSWEFLPDSMVLCKGRDYDKSVSIFPTEFKVEALHSYKVQEPLNWFLNFSKGKFDHELLLNQYFFTWK